MASYMSMLANSADYKEWKKGHEVTNLRQRVLVVTGIDNVPEIGLIEKTVPFYEATDEQLRFNTRVVINKKGQIVKRITREDLLAIDREYAKKYLHEEFAAG